MKINWGKSTVLITGGTGSFGKAFAKYLLIKRPSPVIRIFSRDEFKQHEMQQEFVVKKRQLRFLLGDVRDRERLTRAMEGVEIVIHAAALKHVALGEYNPYEVVKTNIVGTRNVAEVCLDTGVKKAILISSDKAVYPVNLYGSTKLCAERLFIQSNVYGGKGGIFSVVRYGNVLSSRGSVVPIFKKQMKTGKLSITHPDMTRFWITLPQACKFVDDCVQKSRGGEIFVPKLPSVKITDLAKAIAPGVRQVTIGVRPGEKLHEALITDEESTRIKEERSHYVIEPQFPYWRKRRKKRGRVRKPFSYRSDTNVKWLTTIKLKQFLEKL